jgi:hypothetical protein
MHFAVLPPEVNSGRMYAGPGAGPMLTAASAWDELANDLHSAADDFEGVVSGLTWACRPGHRGHPGRRNVGRKCAVDDVGGA